MSWYLMVIKNYFGFSGRARRKEYWMFTLFNVIFAIVALIIDFVLGTNLIIYTLYILAVLFPSLAVNWRRLHDISKSGWWFFIQIIPLIGAIWLLILLVSDSTPGSNQYGPNPKEA